jgi:hypothetical protein
MNIWDKESKTKRITIITIMLIWIKMNWMTSMEKEGRILRISKRFCQRKNKIS